MEAAGGYIQELQAAFLEGGPDAEQAATRRLQLVEQLCGAIRCIQFFQQSSSKGCYLCTLPRAPHRGSGFVSVSHHVQAATSQSAKSAKSGLRAVIGIALFLYRTFSDRQPWHVRGLESVFRSNAKPMTFSL